MRDKTEIAVLVNGMRHVLGVTINDTLLDVLRDHLGLTGTKEGCAAGDCCACTVLLDGRPVNSCLVLAVEADGVQVTTIEGLAQEGKLDPLQEAFVQEGAVQCGFCTPGMLMSAKGLLRVNPKPSEAEVRKGIAGNLCRCTGYVRIVRAILRASDSTAVCQPVAREK
ncbi:MAG: (2Fe-2S)-binding protein [Deltaproteobacteria bacterium]|nr:(2Fe-2S)-binding protein [Deltaproteobacteria bacterium]